MFTLFNSLNYLSSLQLQTDYSLCNYIHFSIYMDVYNPYFLYNFHGLSSTIYCILLSASINNIYCFYVRCVIYLPLFQPPYLLSSLLFFLYFYSPLPVLAAAPDKSLLVSIPLTLPYFISS